MSALFTTLTSPKTCARCGVAITAGEPFLVTGRAVQEGLSCVVLCTLCGDEVFADEEEAP